MVTQPLFSAGREGSFQGFSRAARCAHLPGVRSSCGEHGGRTAALRIENVTFDCHDARLVSAFWTAALGFEVSVDQPGDWMVLRDPAGVMPGIGLQVVPEPKVVKNRVHLDLVPTAGLLEDEVQRLEGIGAQRVRYVENDPDESH